ncbi:MAG: P-II family nitrogen regulator [Candidatus Melainabacteria bacterium]|nr:P-II family nitrogen regulator [Candidatus Melainabacteria bacterium]
MKKIEAIIREESVPAVKTALEKAGFLGMTLINVKGRGRSGGIQLEWRAGTYTVDFLHKVLLMLVVADADSQTVIDIILDICGEPGASGSGKIFVSPVEEVVRIRTRETGEAAI